MDKREFKDSLTNGRCKCGEAPALSDTTVCPVGYINGSYSHDRNGLCACCDTCRQKCLDMSDQVDKAFNNMSEQLRKEVDAVIINEARKAQKAS